MKDAHKALSSRVFHFFENPEGFWARAVQILIFLLIIGSVYLVILEHFFTDGFIEHERACRLANYAILVLFTIEYVLRIATAPNRKRWVVKPLNVVDFLAVFPNYLEFILPFFIDTKVLRSFRIIRMLRFARILRGLRMLRYGNLFRRVLRYRNTILQAIMPVLVLVTVVKGVIWILEYNDLWYSNQNLGELFAIIGFALGIILSQKIGVSYNKYLIR